MSSLVVVANISETCALELKEAKWLHQAASENQDILGQNIVGENALNIFVVSDTHVSWSELLTYAEKESGFFLESVPYKELYNIIVVQVDNLGFYVFGQHGLTNLLAFEAKTMQNWLMNEPATDIPAYIEDSLSNDRVRFILRRDQTGNDLRILLLFCNFANDQNTNPHITSIHFPNHTVSLVEKIQDY